MKFSSSLALLLLANVALAQNVSSFENLGFVNMREGSFILSVFDSEMLSAGLRPAIHRTYNSQSTNHGMFGLGWCSEFDVELDPRDPQFPTLTDCRVQGPITYVRSKAIALDSFPLSLIYESSQNPNERLELRGNQWIRYLSKTEFEIFDRSGKLIKRSRANGDVETLNWNQDGTLARVQTKEGRHVLLRQDAITKRVLWVQWPGMPRLDLRYQGPHLISVGSDQYRYDEMSNLIEVRRRGLKLYDLTYDPHRDVVASLQNLRRCLEQYSFAEMPIRQNLMQVTNSILTICPKKKAELSKFTYIYSKRSDGTILLVSSRVQTPTLTVNLAFDAKTGFAQPIISRLPAQQDP